MHTWVSLPFLSTKRSLTSPTSSSSTSKMYSPVVKLFFLMLISSLTSPNTPFSLYHSSILLAACKAIQDSSVCHMKADLWQNYNHNSTKGSQHHTSSKRFMSEVLPLAPEKISSTSPGGSTRDPFTSCPLNSALGFNLNSRT